MKFYIRVRYITFLLFPRLINKCLVFNGWNVYVTSATEIRSDLSFKEINI